MYELTKINHRLETGIPEYQAAVKVNEVFKGRIQYQPMIDNVLHFHIEHPVMDDQNDYLRTSRIKSIFIKDTDNDKLVIPSDFPEAYRLEVPPMEDGDVLFATSNSVYLLHKLPEVTSC